MTAVLIPNARAAAFHRVLRPLERTGAVVLLSILSGAYLPLLAGDAGEAAATQLAHAVLLPLYGLLGIFIITHPNEFARAAWRGMLALALVVLAGVSTLWSIQPGLSLVRSVSLLAPTALGLMIGARFNARELLRLLAIALGVAGLVSTLVALAFPNEGIISIDYGDAWRGVYGNKNHLGRAMALATVTFVLVALEGGRYRLLAWGAAAAAFLIVLLARAAASLVVCVAVLSLVPLFRSLRFRFTAAMALWMLAILFASIALTVVATNLEATLALLGRDTTLTGRTDIWAAVMASIAERPWLGYGYSAFWQEWSGPSASVLSAVGWQTPHSHNGVLDLWLDFGAVGMAIFVLGLVVAGRVAVSKARHGEGSADLWPVAFLTFLVLINMSEAIVLKQHNLFWVLYVAILAAPREARPSVWRRQAESPRPHLMGRPSTASGHVSPGVRRTHGRTGRHG